MISKYEVFTSSVACISRDIQRIERVEMAKYGMKGPHAHCLLVLNRYPKGITAAQLCELCEKDKAAISRIISELEEAGMVYRKARNGILYRAPLVLTKKGAQAAAAVNRRAQLAVEQAGEGLDDAQREVFYQVLAMIAGNLHAICKDGLQETE